MKTRRLSPADNGGVIEADLAIVGAGPVGLAIADSCARAGIDVLLLESGLEQQDDRHEALNAVECLTPKDTAARATFHGPQVPLWSDASQAYGVRCRGLGGSTQGWAGKSACFDPLDFEQREWIAHSGWPLGRDELAPHIASSGMLLGLCPDEPEPSFAASGLHSFHWQFARSRINRLDIMRFGRDLAPKIGRSARCLLDATVTQLGFDEASASVTHLEVAGLSGARLRVRPQRVVLAASAIENARLLLASPCGAPGAQCNRHDVVGRFLIDHAAARLGRVDALEAARLSRVFGFRSRSHAGRAHMFQHGLALDAATQRDEGILNGAVWFAQERGPDNPWAALHRLLHRRSRSVGTDVAAVIRGSGLILRGTAARTLASPKIPEWVRRKAVEAAIRISPNAAAIEFQTGSLPHKLSGLTIEAIIETAPRRDNRIALSDRRDALGQPMPTANWEVGDLEQRTLRYLASAVEHGFAGQDWPAPVFEGWVGKPDASLPIIDCAHSMGTTRMARDPLHGVVDPDCRVFGSRNLYCAGGSVFPTAGHANPTWMFLALAMRLAEHLATQDRPVVSDPKARASAPRAPMLA